MFYLGVKYFLYERLWYLKRRRRLKKKASSLYFNGCWPSHNMSLQRNSV